MGNEITVQGLPKAANGLTLPLRTLLDSQALKAHRAMLAMELEVLAMKTDRFGWERERGNPIQDRLITDWMDTLQDYPLDEVQRGISACLDTKPGKMPNERDVLFQVHKDRARQLLTMPKPAVDDPVRPPPTSEEKARVAEMMRQAGFAPRGFDDDKPIGTCAKCEAVILKRNGSRHDSAGKMICHPCFEETSHD
jgi:hypothetical protein